MNTERDFTTISPSAGALLMMKAMTDIPFAKETASMVGDLDKYIKDVREKRSKVFLGRMIHFENRYKTIDAALQELAPSQVLEISSGFSCRGLAMVQEQGITYIDTDLPEFIANKKELVSRLIQEKQLHSKGRLYIEPLNALDQAQFDKVTGMFASGLITVVNEGLLVYLDETEKRKLCAMIYQLLKEHGGHWITGDIYIKRNMEGLLRQPQEEYDEELTKFLEQHRINDNKFDSYEAAEAFFLSCGFAITRKIDIVYEQLSSLRYIPHMPEESLVKEWMQGRETWVLEAL